MHIILGGTGRVGSATARALLDAGQDVTIVTRVADRGAELKKAGARIAELDIRNTDALREIFQTGKRALILNPPADPSTDTNKEERRNVVAIIAALKGSGLEKLVVQSAYGAFEGECCGDLTVLYQLEKELLAQPIPAAINRGAYYMSNWTGMVEAIHKNGKLPSFFPANLVLPMVAPVDLGRAAARRLLEPVSETSVQHVEGPKRYTARQVADAFSSVLGRNVEVEEIPPEALEKTFEQFGFSQKAAASYACMTRRLINGQTDTSSEPVRGRTSLFEFVQSTV